MQPIKPYPVIFEQTNHKFMVEYRIQDGTETGGPHDDIETAIKSYYDAEKIMNGNTPDRLGNRAIKYLDGTYQLINNYPYRDEFVQNKKETPTLPQTNRTKIWQLFVGPHSQNYIPASHAAFIVRSLLDCITEDNAAKILTAYDEMSPFLK